jgi:serine/threonine protein kinase
VSLNSGTRLGPYEVTAQVGAGGMGEVYKARDTRLNRTVAIKVLPPDVAGDPERCARFGTPSYMAPERGGEKERVADAPVDAAFVPPRGGGPGYVVMIRRDSLVAQPFDLASRRTTGPAVAIPGAGSAKTFTGPSTTSLLTDGSSR